MTYKQHLKRREFLWGISQYTLTLLVLGRASQLGFVPKAVATESNANNGSSSFTTDEFKIIDSITSIIIPTDNNPGAKEAGIAEYVLQVFQSEGSETVEKTKAVLSLINQQAFNLFSAGYNDLTQKQQENLVAAIASTPDFFSFWNQLRTLTVLRFYSLPEGYEPVGQPGPNIDRGGFPALGC